MKKLIPSLAILFLLTLGSYAQVPQKMSYQSVVRNASNQIVANQNIGVKISIVEGSLTGTIVYSETHTTTTNANGLFTLEAGGGNSTTGTFAAINWANGSHYIKSEIDVTGGTNYALSGTMELLSVPYAMYAGKSAETTALQNQIAGLQNQIIQLKTPDLYLNLTSLGSNSSFFKSEIISSGLSLITSSGIIWSTNPQPTIELNTKIVGTANAGIFFNAIDNLTPQTTYYVRSFATNSYGTSYSNQVVCTTTLNFGLTSVTIGTQVWSAKNIELTTYRDGTPIPQVTDPAILSNLTTGAWCYYDNDPTNGTLYGKLYNWYAVAGIYDAASLNNPTLRKQLVPIGWHVPSDIEWTNLIQYLDPSATATFNGFQSLIAGGKMKEMGTANWNSPNVGADNSTGFTGLPGGILDTYMETPADTVHGFYSVGSDGIWWSTTVQDTVHAWTCSLSYYYGGVATFYSNKAFGFSVRCLKD